MEKDAGQVHNKVDFISNEQLTIQDLPGENDNIDVLCRFAATFPKQDDLESGLSALREDLRSLGRQLYWSLDKSPEYYLPKMKMRVEQIRNVLQERANSDPACKRAREYFLAAGNPSALFCWTSLSAVEDQAFLVDVFFIIKNLPGSTVHCKSIRLSTTPRIANRYDQDATPMPEARAAISLDRIYEPVECERLTEGNISQDEDDK